MLSLVRTGLQKLTCKPQTFRSGFLTAFDLPFIRLAVCYGSFPSMYRAAPLYADLLEKTSHGIDRFLIGLLLYAALRRGIRVLKSGR